VNWKGSGSVSQSAEEYLIFHKFGHVSNNNVVNFVNVLCIFQCILLLKPTVAVLVFVSRVIDLSCRQNSTAHVP